MFAPVVVLLRNSIGKVKFNRIRGRVIGLHCKTITNFCNQVGLKAPVRQNLIRLAKSNGQKLGFLA